MGWRCICGNIFVFGNWDEYIGTWILCKLGSYRPRKSSQIHRRRKCERRNLRRGPVVSRLHIQRNRSYDPPGPRFPGTLRIMIGSLLSFRSFPKRRLRLDNPNRKGDTREGSARWPKISRLPPAPQREEGHPKIPTIICGSAINGSSCGYIYLSFSCARDTSTRIHKQHQHQIPLQTSLL